MNVGLLTEMMNIGGAATLVLRQARWLKENGHGVIVFSAGGPLADELAQSGIGHTIIPSFRPGIAFTPEQLAADGAALARAATDESLDLLLAQAHWPFSLAAAAAGARLPVFLHLISPVYFPPKTAASLEFMRAAAAQHRVLSTGVVTSIAFARYAGVEENLPVVNVPAEAAEPSRSRAEVRQELGLDAAATVILCVARLDKDRAPMIPHLALAVQQLKPEYPDLALVVVGDGTEMETVRAAASHAAIFTGYRRDLADFYAACDVFVSEGSVVEEAARFGVPAIVTNSTMFPDRAGMAFAIFGLHYVDHYFAASNGVVAQEPLKEALRLILSNPERAAAIGAAGKAFVERHWNLDAIMRDQLEFFAGHGVPGVRTVSEAAIAIRGGLDDDVDYAAQLLASLPDAERFSVVADAPIPWTRYFSMPLDHGQRLAQASWRATLGFARSYRLRGRDLEGEVEERHEHVRAALRAMPMPPVDDGAGVRFGKPGESVTILAVAPGEAERALRFAAALEGVIAFWEPDGDVGDGSVTAAWCENHPAGPERERFLRLSGPVPWSVMGRLFRGAGVYADGGSDRFDDRRELARRLGLTVERF